MRTQAIHPAPLPQGDVESRVTIALTRGVLENLKPNRVMIPLFALVICAMFSQWVPFTTLVKWYLLVVAGLVPSILVTQRFPRHDVPPSEIPKWLFLAAGANFIFVSCWGSLGWWLWVPNSDFNHMLIQLVLAATLAAHANLVGPSRHVSLPAFAVYALVMTLTPLQAHETTYNYLALVTPMYVGYIAVMAKQHHARARIALVLEEEKNALLEELVRSKMESDRARDRAEAASLAKSQFLANMSHELRTPLNAIIGFSELISTRLFKDVEKHYEYAGLIHSSGAHLLTLINDILDLAKIEAGRWRLTEAEIDLDAVAAEMLQLVAWKADENNCSLKTEIAPGLPLLFADGRAIKQVWLNLLSNAVKFTHRGNVTAFARQDADGAILFGVADTGIGISPEDQVRVFESFGQGQHDVAIADKGTGLGLAIVRGLSEAHGGHAALESEPNKGTIVTIRLPASRARPRALRAIA